MTVNAGQGRSALVAKLSHFTMLSDADMRVLDTMFLNEERFGAGVDIITEGAAPRPAFVLTEGMACRYRLMPDGRRQITSFLLPGDAGDLHGFLFKTMDYSISTLTPIRLVPIDWDTMIDVAMHRPRLAMALWWAARQEEAMARERIVSLGRRNAHERVAYILCELVWRQTAIGLSEHHAIWLPLTQADLADTLGLTTVHVNRVLQEFRRRDLIALEHRRLTLLAAETLQGIAGLNEDYLHLDGAPGKLEGYFDRMERDRAREGDRPQDRSP